MQIAHNALVKFVQYYLYARSSFSFNLDIIIQNLFPLFKTSSITGVIIYILPFRAKLSIS